MSSKEMVFDPQSHILIHEEEVEQVTSHKCLGICFDSQLNWALTKLILFDPELTGTCTF